jgi:hypothetical protein
MIASLDQALFASPDTRQADLIALLQLGYEERHIIRTIPTYQEEDSTQPVHAWIERVHAFCPRLSQDIIFALEVGALDGETIQGTLEVSILPVIASDWSQPAPVLSLSDALRLLRTPLKILLESRSNDWIFLQRMLLGHPDLLKRVREGYQRGWVDALNGGGISGICAHILGIAPNIPAGLPLTDADRQRIFTLFDRDIDPKSPQPGVPSPDVQKTIRACKQRLSPHQYHCLTRRMIENYLPSDALGAWVNRGGGGANQGRRQKLDDFKALPNAQARHFAYMKDNFVSTVADLFSERDDDTWRVWMDAEARRDPALRQERQEIAEKLQRVL